MSSASTDWLCEHLTKLLALLLLILTSVWLWLSHRHNYWKRQKMPYIKPTGPLGNFGDIIFSRKDPCTFFHELYWHEISQNQSAVGIYIASTPCLLLRDMDLIKAVVIKDFNKFPDRNWSSYEGEPIGSQNLFFMKHPKWKDLRVKLSPVFSSGKMKQMFPLIVEVAEEYDKQLSGLPVDPKTNSTMIEVKDWNALFTTDVIALVAFGVHANSLRNPGGEFRTHGKRIFHFTWRRSIEFKFSSFLPTLVKLLHIKIFSQESNEFLRKAINTVIDERIRQGNTRNDLIDILVNWKTQAEAERMEGKKPFILENDCLPAQASIFFTAGFETTSTTMSFCMYELSKHRDVQERLRDEIRAAWLDNDGVLSYEVVMELKYLDAVVKEVLRLYPPLPYLDRVCMVPKGEKGYSLAPFGYEHITIPHGMPVYIPACALHMDPKHFPNPDTFNPDRFLPENINQNNMQAYMPFGIGPHNCIGERLGYMQVKVGLVHFFKNHYVSLCEKSPKTMALEPRAVILQSIGGIFCNIVRDPLQSN